MRWWLVFACGIMVLALAACGGSTATPTPRPISAEAAIAQLKTAGFPIGEMVVYTAATDQNNLLGRPNQYVSKATFRDTRLPVGDPLEVASGGSVETFATEADMLARKTYIEGIAKSPPFAEYDYGQGRILLRLSSKLTPDQALAYQQALATVK